MLTQYRFTLRADRPAHRGWGYRLYAALLEQVPEKVGTLLHANAATPVSQYLCEEKGSLIWTVNLLGTDCEGALGPVLQELSTLHLWRDGAELTVEGKQVCRVLDSEELLDRAADLRGRHRLEICTPAAFKQQGRYVNLPTTRLLMQSLLRKWNGCILDCPIEDEDGLGMEALARGLEITDFKLQSASYPLKSAEISGFAGTMTLENRLTGFQQQLADALLLFGDFSGLGIKTALGMGGLRHR